MAIERDRDVETRDPAFEHSVGRLDVERSVAVRHVAAVVAGGRRLDLGIRDRWEPEVVEHGAHGQGGATPGRQHGLLGDGLDAGIDLPVALDREPLVQVVGVVVAAPERVVVAGHHGVAGRHEVGAREELAHQLGGLADGGVRRDRIVARRDLEIEPGGDHVLGEDRAGSARDRQDERDARDRAVLHALRAGGPHDRDAARLEVEHRLPLGRAHQRLRAGARREPHLHAARCVGRPEERLRPRRVVAVGEHGLGAVHRERLGVRHEAADRELEIAALLDRALRHDAGPARLRAHEQRDRVQRRVAGDADRGLDLGEPARGSLGRVGGEQRRALLEVRHVRLVPGEAARAQLLEREHQLDGVERAHDPRELGRREAARKPHQLVAGDVDVDELAGERLVRQRHRLGRHLEVEAVCHQEAVDDVEVARVAPVHPHDDPVGHHELGLRIARPVRRDEPELGERLDDQLAAELALGARRKAVAVLGRLRRQAGLARRRPRPPRARTQRWRSRPSPRA